MVGKAHAHPSPPLALMPIGSLPDCNDGSKGKSASDSGSCPASSRSSRPHAPCAQTRRTSAFWPSTHPSIRDSELLWPECNFAFALPTDLQSDRQPRSNHTGAGRSGRQADHSQRGPVQSHRCPNRSWNRALTSLQIMIGAYCCHALDPSRMDACPLTANRHRAAKSGASSYP